MKNVFLIIVFLLLLNISTCQAESSLSPSQEHQKEVSNILDAYDSSPTIQKDAATAGSESVKETLPIKSVIEENSNVEPRPVQHVPMAKTIRTFINRKVNEIEMGTEFSHIVYKEPIFNLKSRGNMYGIYAVYTFRPAKKEEEVFNKEIVNMYRIDAKVSFGQMDYSSTSGTISGIPDYLFELRGVMGYDWLPYQDWMLTPYAGIGYRRLSDDSAGKQTQSGANGYGRVANYIYLPLGLEINHPLSPTWSIGATGEVDVFVWGYQESYLSDVDSSLPDLFNTQKRGIGLRTSMKLARNGDKFDFLLEPFVRYWHISDSNVSVATSSSGTTIAGLEPNNNSTEIGVKAAINF